MATYALPISPFVIPNVVYLQLPPGRKQDGVQSAPQLMLSQLPREIVEQLCADFQYEMLKQWDEANKPKPEIRIPIQPTLPVLRSAGSSGFPTIEQAASMSGLSE